MNAVGGGAVDDSGSRERGTSPARRKPIVAEEVIVRRAGVDVCGRAGGESRIPMRTDGARKVASPMRRKPRSGRLRSPPSDA